MTQVRKKPTPQHSREDTDLIHTLSVAQPRLSSPVSAVLWTQWQEYNQITKRLVSEIYENFHLNEKGESTRKTKDSHFKGIVHCREESRKTSRPSGS